MKISSIGNSPFEPFSPIELSKDEVNTINKKIGDTLSISGKNADWYNETINSALNKLENSIQLDNSMPLDKAENQPIESIEEARIVLGYVNTPFFKAQAFKAQANLSPQDVVHLFTEA
ncbi:MAG: hypothetical protein M9949_03505 [Candidatus Kapabacteria bacterium]|nr:hypothetical protein [Candidatus Kapabacteria bacterium]